MRIQGSRWRLRLLALMTCCGLGCDVSVNEGDDDGDGESGSCYALCANDLAICTSYPGLDREECGEIAEDDCGAEPKEQKFIEGCICPDDGSDGECTAADGVPDWI